VIACAVRCRVLSAGSSLRGRRIDGDGSRGTVLGVSARKAEGGQRKALLHVVAPPSGMSG
jgi:hypothetical protein